jgi:hypothetical protein
MSTDNSIMDTVYKVAFSKPARVGYLLTGILGSVPDVGPILEADISSLATLHQPDEELGIGDLLLGRRVRVSACVWVHPPVGCASPKQHEGQDQGLSRSLPPSSH